ncbi:hypothetical protein ACQFN5_09665 [Klebsiella sp. WOUb02]|uniref:hypothetical protein n=1 Tax=Klebsiella sp. WOUb02 TaxID=3161071 RepID=UPI003CF09A98
MFTVAVPAGYESPYIGSPYTFNADSVITIELNGVKILDEGSRVAFVSYSLTIDTDPDISFSRTDNFNCTDPAALESEAREYLTKIYSGNPS